MKMKRTIAAVAIVLGMASAASAADIPMAPPPPPPAPPAPAFDWSGPYIGAFGGYTLGLGTNLGGQVGYNFDLGGFVAGIEARAGVGLAGPALFASINGRVGFVVGSNALIYAVAGVGYIPAVPALFYTAGGGVEFAVGDSVSLFAEARALGGGGCCTVTFQGGLNWHF